MGLVTLGMGQSWLRHDGRDWIFSRFFRQVRGDLAVRDAADVLPGIGELHLHVHCDVARALAGCIGGPACAEKTLAGNLDRARLAWLRGAGPGRPGVRRKNAGWESGPCSARLAARCWPWSPRAIGPGR